ncbi:MAG: dephospho-CoA kinase [Legionellales bacterium]
MVYCVGLTGNIASGKSTAAAIFSKLGIVIINADEIARKLTAVNQASYKQISEYFGQEILLSDGQINRRQLRDIVFSNQEARQWLEKLLHPLIRKKIEDEITLCDSPYCVIEIPLLIDKINYPYLNKILLINAPIDVQVARVMTRDHCSKEQALAVLSTQADVKVRLKYADDVITNNAELNLFEQQVRKLHELYLEQARQSFL